MLAAPDQELGGQANAFAGLASLYDLASLADPRLSPEAEAKRVEGIAPLLRRLLPLHLLQSFGERFHLVAERSSLGVAIGPALLAGGCFRVAPRGRLL